MAAVEELPRDLVFVDLETTGGNAAYDRITEVGVVRVTDGVLVDEWSSLVNPERPIPSYIESFTGISNEMVAGAPRFAEIAGLVREKLRDAVFVAHNARFDYSFLRSEFQKTDSSFRATVLCTVKLSRRLFPEHARHNLDAVMQRNGLTCGARHRALGDARVLHDFWFKLKREVAEPRLAAAVRSAIGAYAMPAQLPGGLADEIPEGWGAYRFFGEADALLLVGKSAALRAGVCGHFAGGDADAGGRRQSGRPRTDRRLAALVRRVDWVETAGELGAMLREAQWLKERQPLYNRRIKGDANTYTLRLTGPQPHAAAREQPRAPAPSQAARAHATEAAAGDPAGVATAVRAQTGVEAVAVETVTVETVTVEAVAVEAVDARELLECFGLFHSEKDARKALVDIARSRQLCLKVLGLEDGAGSRLAGACVAYPIGQCKGACVGKEPPMLHDLRLRLALSSLKLRPWPFPGRIAIRERGAWSGAAEFMHGADLHVVDHWTYLGTARTEEELALLAAKGADAAFDAGVYKILARYFAKNPKLDWLDLCGTASAPRSGSFETRRR